MANNGKHLWVEGLSILKSDHMPMFRSNFSTRGSNNAASMPLNKCLHSRLYCSDKLQVN